MWRFSLHSMLLRLFFSYPDFSSSDYPFLPVRAAPVPAEHLYNLNAFHHGGVWGSTSHPPHTVNDVSIIIRTMPWNHPHFSRTKLRCSYMISRCLRAIHHHNQQLLTEHHSYSLSTRFCAWEIDFCYYLDSICASPMDSNSFFKFIAAETNHQLIL